jgi:hypothetical protein
MTNYTFRPIDQWPDGWRDPDRDATRVPSPFRASYNDTLGLLGDELYHHDATHAHIQAAGFGPGDIRRDGMPRQNARSTHPGVILTVVTPERTVVLATDRFLIHWADQGDAWHHNLRACVLGLRDLRRMTRYGLNGGDAQYAGFAALGAGGPVALGSAMSTTEARRVLSDAAGWQLQTDPSPAGVRRAYRDAARRLHPDRSDGDALRMAEVNRARDVLVAAGV